MDNNLTDRAFWKSFWESRIGLIFKLKPNYVFGDILGKIIAEKNAKTAIELGGFPGYYAIYLKKYKGLKNYPAGLFYSSRIGKPAAGSERSEGG
jgi:hypothetical protein